MKPSVERVPSRERQSFAYRSFRRAAFEFDWHMHPEAELTWIVSGRGYRHVGESVESFDEGDLVLLGPELPHSWEGTPTRGRRCVSVVVQFLPQCFGSQWMNLPEMQRIRRLLARSRAGLHFGGRTARQAGASLEAMQDLDPLRRMVRFLEVLECLAASRHVRPLTDVNEVVDAMSPTDRRRLEQVQQFIHAHMNQAHVSVPQIAEAMNLSVSAFGRFFKRATGRGFIEYVNQQRIAHACRLLSDTDASVTEVCYQTGFGALTNFNRVFRRIKGTTPREYRRRIMRR